MILKEEIKLETFKGQFPVWGAFYAWFSLIFGTFLLVYGSYLHGIFAKLFDVIPGWTLALAVILSAVVKLVGIYTRNKKMMRVGIVSLSAVWTGLTAVYVVYSFGIGYPSPSFLFMGLVMVACYRIAWKGNYSH